MYKPYTKEEINIVLNCVKSSPGNLRVAFTMASIKIGRTRDSVATKYYSSIRKQYQSITVASDTTSFKGKNKPRQLVKHEPNPLFISILNRYPLEKLPQLLDKFLSNEAKSDVIISIASEL